MAVSTEGLVGKRAPSLRERAGEHIKGAPLAHRIALLCMLVYVSKIGNIFPQIGAFHLGKILIGAALVSLVFEGGGWRDGLTRQPAVRALLAMVALVFITAPFGIWPRASVMFIFDVYLKDIIFFFLLVVTLVSYKDVRRAIWMFAVSAAVMDIMLIKYGLPGIGQFTLGKNETAMTSTMAAALLVPLNARGLGKLLKIGLIVFLIISIAASGSRGSYLGIAIVLTTFTYLRVGKRIAITGLILAMVAYVAYLNLPAGVMGNVDSIVDYKQDYNMTAPDGRIQVWKRGLHIIANNPITGVGISNFPIAEGMMHRYVKGENWMQPHNSFIQVAAEIGLVGFYFFMVLLRRVGQTAHALFAGARSDEERRLGLSLWLVLVGFLVTGFFLHSAFATIFDLMIAISVGAQRIYQMLPQKGA